MQFETCKEANKTGGNFYFFKKKRKKKVGEKERAQKDNAVLTKLSPTKAFCDRTICFKGSYWLPSPTPSKEKNPSSILRLALKFLVSEC